MSWIPTLVDAGGWVAFVGLGLLVMWMIATGRLVPRSVNADWRALALDAMAQNRKWTETSRVVDKAFQALPKDPGEQVT